MRLVSSLIFTLVLLVILGVGIWIVSWPLILIMVACLVIWVVGFLYKDILTLVSFLKGNSNV